MGRRNFSSVVPLQPRYSLAATSLLVRTIRHEKGWTTLAEMHRVTGVHENLLRDYEQGRRRPSPETWHAILTAAGIDPAFLDVLLANAEGMAKAFAGDPLNRRRCGAEDFLLELEDLVRAVTSFLERTSEPAADPPDAEDQLRRLLICERSLRPEVIRITSEFHSHPLAILCCARSNAAERPEIARELAELAEAVASTLPPR